MKYLLTFWIIVFSIFFINIYRTNPSLLIINSKDNLLEKNQKMENLENNIDIDQKEQTFSKTNDFYLNTKYKYKLYFKDSSLVDFDNLDSESDYLNLQNASRTYNLQCFPADKNYSDFINNILLTVVNEDFIKETDYKDFILYSFKDPNIVLLLWTNDDADCYLYIKDFYISKNFDKEKIIEFSK